MLLYHIPDPGALSSISYPGEFKFILTKSGVTGSGSTTIEYGNSVAVQLLPCVTIVKVVSPPTFPDTVNVDVPLIAYQFPRPANGFVTFPLVVIDKPGSRSRTTTLVAPPPKVKVTGSIALPTHKI